MNNKQVINKEFLQKKSVAVTLRLPKNSQTRINGE
jgi:hypothetical protein